MFSQSSCRLLDKSILSGGDYMKEDIYIRLAEHLDNLPGGFPSTESGVEQRILKQLFTPEDANIALSLTLIAEAPHVIARRAKISIEKATEQLDSMEKKGLIYSIHTPNKPPKYIALQFIVGIWEFQVNKLNPELVKDVGEYMKSWADTDIWEKVPQIRSIPVEKSIDNRVKIMAYEKAANLIRSKNKIVVTPCICRTEQKLIGKGCDKPIETCLSFGTGAEFYERNGMGRLITKEEALSILEQADSAGLVLSPGNAKNSTFICACCGCCCGVLRTLKYYPNPAKIISSPFVVEFHEETCISCSICIQRCQMDALQLKDGKIILDKERCIGCGLCVTTCPANSLRLIRKTKDEQHAVPRNFIEMNIKLGHARGKLSMGKLFGMAAKSKIDRFIGPK